MQRIWRMKPYQPFVWCPSPSAAQPWKGCAAPRFRQNHMHCKRVSSRDTESKLLLRKQMEFSITWGIGRIRHGKPWLSDCGSLVEHVNWEIPAKFSDKRLGIEMASIRQQLWTDDVRRTSSELSCGGDSLSWISTSTMISDVFTKSMRADLLLKTLHCNTYKIVRQKWPRQQRQAVFPSWAERRKHHL